MQSWGNSTTHHFWPQSLSPGSLHELCLLPNPTILKLCLPVGPACPSSLSPASFSWRVLHALALSLASFFDVYLIPYWSIFLLWSVLLLRRAVYSINVFKLYSSRVFAGMGMHECMNRIRFHFNVILLGAREWKYIRFRFIAIF